MQTKSIVFTHAYNAELQDKDLDASLSNDQILLEASHTIISPGTEAAIYRDEFWSTLPVTPGYGAVGTVLDTGASVEGITKGDQIFCYNHHSKHSIGSSKRPACSFNDIPPQHAVFTRMAAVAMTAVRVSPPEIGDWVVIQGLGLVGQFASQLYQLGGARVLAIDPSPARRNIALNCGVQGVVDPAAGDVTEQIKDLIDGEGAAVIVEATGVPALAHTATTFAAPQGEVILLGSPRGEHQTDLTQFLDQVHLWGNGCVTLKGAHEWRYPIAKSPDYKHSIQRNCEIILGLIRDGKLVVEPMITDIASPESCQDLYQGLKNEPDQHLGVIFDWSKV
jgi:2-desacetyl-2-hydroxyethyl bacteriochlorophyllide A dehydrogenase